VLHPLCTLAIQHTFGI